MAQLSAVYIQGFEEIHQESIQESSGIESGFVRIHGDLSEINLGIIRSHRDSLGFIGFC